jgi:methionyl-tRNA formyltransferase
MNVALIGSVSSSWHALRALLRGQVDVTGVLGLDERQAARVSDYRSLRDSAESAGLPFLSFEKIGEPGVADFLRRYSPDWLWIIGLSQLAPPELRALARKGGIGFHPTLLPRGRGRAPVAWTILLQEPAAVSLFHLTDEPDAGDLIVQREVPVLPDDYAQDLIDRTNASLEEVIIELAPRMRSGDLPRTPQDPSRATYYPKRTPADGRIDWTQPMDSILRLIRAAGRPYPGAFAELGGERITVWRARPAKDSERPPGTEHALPGAVLDRRVSNHLLVRALDGALWFTEFEKRGRRDG